MYDGNLKLGHNERNPHHVWGQAKKDADVARTPHIGEHAHTHTHTCSEWSLRTVKWNVSYVQKTTYSKEKPDRVIDGKPHARSECWLKWPGLRQPCNNTAIKPGRNGMVTCVEKTKVEILLAISRLQKPYKNCTNLIGKEVLGLSLFPFLTWVCRYVQLACSFVGHSPSEMLCPPA